MSSPAALPVITTAMIAQLREALGPLMEGEHERLVVSHFPSRKVEVSEMQRRRYEGFARKALVPRSLG